MDGAAMEGAVEKKRMRTEKSKGSKHVFNTNPIAGTRDFLPEDMLVRNYISSVWHKASKRFGFVEYDAPILEPFAIYERKGGEELKDQMYTFKDRSGQLLALRPEMTPTLVRLVEQIRKDCPSQLRWYSVPQCWRYETLTKGRKREFYQWNIDIIGSVSIAADADVISTAINALELFGFNENEVQIRVSSRKLVQTILQSCNVPDEHFEDACIIIDKMEKLSVDDIIALFANIDVDEEQADKIIDAMGITDIDEIVERFPEAKSAAEEIKKLFKLLSNYGYDKWCVFDATIIRGLSYYTGIVFEGKSIISELQRAICGGGRYDKIFTSLGASTDLPAVGFGMGDCVLLELLIEKYAKKAKEDGKDVEKEDDRTSLLRKMFKLDMDVCVVPRVEALRGEAMTITKMLRDADLRTDLYIGNVRKLGNCFKYADKINAKFVVLVAEGEWADGKVKVKDYTVATTGNTYNGEERVDNETVVPIAELCAFIKEHMQSE